MPRLVPVPKLVTDSSQRAGAADRDEDLALRARAGDREAFAALYERFAGTVHGVLLAAAPQGEARDLVQEVFLLALRAIGELQDPRRVGPWLCTIARNRARDAHKVRSARAEWSDDFEPIATDIDESAGEDEARRVLGAIRSLPECYREPLIQRLVEGSTGVEIAERTGLTHGSVRINLHRGMKLLRERLGGPRAK